MKSMNMHGEKIKVTKRGVHKIGQGCVSYLVSSTNIINGVKWRLKGWSTHIACIRVLVFVHSVLA